jgi:Trypsin-like peptidase domain
MEWSERHRGTPVWMVGARIAGAIRTAADAAAHEPPDPEAEKKEQAARAEERRQAQIELRRRVRQTVIVAPLVALVAAAVAYQELAWVPRILAWLVIVLVLLLVLANAARRAMSQEERLHREQLQRQLDQLNASMLRSLRAGDAIRLQRRYDEYLDWAEIFGWLVHKPWLGESLESVALRPPVDQATLPAAFSVGVGQVSAERLGELSAQAGASVFQPGWLTAVYDAVERPTMIQIGVRLGLDEAAAEADAPDPTSDTSEDREAPRPQLARAVRRGDHRSLVESDLADAVFEFVAGQTLDRLADRVTVLSTADDANRRDQAHALPPPVDLFEPPEGLHVLAEKVRGSVVRVESDRKIGTGVVLDADGTIATTSQVTAGAEWIAVVDADGNRHEAKLEREVQALGLSLVAAAGVGERAVTISDASLKQGDAVVSLALAPAAVRPSVGFGLVVAPSQVRGRDGASAPDPLNGLLIAYQGGTADAGTAAFALDGRLVGIHYESSRGEAATDRSAAVSGAVAAPDAAGRLKEDEGWTQDRATAQRFLAPVSSAGDTTTASRFLGELTSRGGERLALLREHWRDPVDDYEVEDTIPGAAEVTRADTPIGELTGGVGFLKPLRVIVHRIDLPRVSPFASLRSGEQTAAVEREGEREPNTRF